MIHAAPAGSPSDKYAHFIIRKGEAVRVGLSPGIMAPKWWDSPGNFRGGVLNISRGHLPEIKDWPRQEGPL